MDLDTGEAVRAEPITPTTPGRQERSGAGRASLPREADTRSSSPRASELRRLDGAAGVAVAAGGGATPSDTGSSAGPHVAAMLR